MQSNNAKNIDPIFSNARLARIYDAFNPDRSDLEPYINLAKEFKAKNIIDLGCGTGVFALQLAHEGFAVVGIDPAHASIDVAKAKPGAENVRWIVGDASVLSPNSADAVVMTGNVAQAIVDPGDWVKTIRQVKSSLTQGGYFIFETRKPEAKAWQDWTKEKSFHSISIPDVGRVDGWVELKNIDLPLVSFRWTYLFHKDGSTLTSDSTLRFRNIEEITENLQQGGFVIKGVREAPDRLGKEYVIIAQAVQ